ncbi:hypothetical protein PRIPAC_75788, partial [Pristionchus pacificus]|uniref:Uncharacterized protein n=1 Tax=Pristionchus pacificus TaxID=54126 RepID=A0A2A6CFV0_PRIPA
MSAMAIPDQSESASRSWRKGDFALANCLLTGIDWLTALKQFPLPPIAHSTLHTFVDSIAFNPVYILTMTPLMRLFPKKVRVAVRREAIRKEGKRILTSNGRLFSQMRSLSKQKAAVSALWNSDGTFATSPSDKAEALTSQFSSVFTVDN